MLTDKVIKENRKVQKSCAGTVSVVFTNGKKPVHVISSDPVSLSDFGCTPGDLKRSNLEYLLKKGFLKVSVLV